MSLLLEWISFHETPFRSDALNLRRDATAFVLVPEWRRGISIRAEDSVAAYAIESVQGRTIRIAAEFRNLNPMVATVQVRAVALRSGFALPVLGDVTPRSVAFGSGPLSGPQVFELSGPALAATGVGVHRVDWRWECRASFLDPWQPFAESQHRIFVTLRLPTAPWHQVPYTPFNTQLPWSSVLEHACAWAQGAQTIEEAASRITRAVYALGETVVSYDCPGLGSTHYTRYAPAAIFECSEFLELLAGGPGNGALINCVDCAAITSTFANILGADLWQSGMFSADGALFALNPILAIGSNVWQPACGWPGFGYHEVAWEGACGAGQDVYDACLRVNGGPDPARPPRVPLLPRNMRFDDAGGGQYRDRLCTLAGQLHCLPQPGTTRQRRPVV